MNQIICGNNIECIKQLDDNLVDLSITSPPYNKKEGKNSGKIANAVKNDLKENYKIY